jgi:hypothetical protein
LLSSPIISNHRQFAGAQQRDVDLLRLALIMKTRWKWGIAAALLCVIALSTVAAFGRPLAKVEHEGIASDCGPYEWLAHVPPPRTHDFANVLVEDWVSIPPNHFYGATIELAPSSYPKLRVAGHYRLSGSYFSGGPLESHRYYKLKPFSKEVANLPAESWQGVAYSNSVAVYVNKKKN